MDFKDIPGSGVNLPYDDVAKIHGRLNAIERSPCASDRIRAAVEVIREILGVQAVRTGDDDSAEPAYEACTGETASCGCFDCAERRAWIRSVRAGAETRATEAAPLDRALRAVKAVESAYEAQDREAYDRASERLMLAVLGMGTADRARYSRIMSTRVPLPMWPLVP